jgi:hypothetical protein
MSEQTNTFLSSKFWISDKYFSQPKLLLCNETLEKSDNQEWTSETLTTLVTKDTGRGQTKQQTQPQYNIQVSSLPISMPD